LHEPTEITQQTLLLCIHFTLSLCIYKIVMKPGFFRPLNRIRYLHILDINAPQAVWK